jgi:putative ABC transport system permease protein
MLRHYLAIALRNLRRAPFTAAVNVFTLGLGLVTFIAAYAVVSFWSRGESQFANADRTFAVTTRMELRDGSVRTGMRPLTTQTYWAYLKNDFPEFEAVARATVFEGGVWLSAGDRSRHLAAMAVDPELLDIFDLPFVAGDPKSALQAATDVVITEDVAVALFDTPANALGKPVTLAGDAGESTIRGVIAKIAEPSHLGQSAAATLRFDAIMTWDGFQRFRRVSRGGPAVAPPPRPRPDNWLGFHCCTTYVLLKEGSGLTLASLNQRLSEWAQRRIPEDQQALAQLDVGAVPVRGLMVASLDAQLFGAAGEWLSVASVLLALGALVLVVACINYANLATARATRRAREVGLRKVIGASRWQVIAQYVLDAALTTGAALVIALVAVQLLAPALREAAGIDLRVGLSLAGPGVWLFLAALLAAVTVLGAAYPSFVLSGVRPLEALRVGRMRVGPRFLSTVLVGTQFAVASFLLIAIFVMYSQGEELERTALGTGEDQYLVVTNRSAVSGVTNDVLHDELARIPQVKGVTDTNPAPWAEILSLAINSRTPEDVATRTTSFANGVGYDFFETLDVPVLAGRVFDRDRNDLSPASDDLLPNPPPANVVIDEMLARELGFASPAAAVGQTMYYHYDNGKTPRANVIIGVVASRSMYLLGSGAKSNEYWLSAGNPSTIVRLAADDVAGGRAAVEATWKRLAPALPIEARFMDDLFEQSYRKFAVVSRVFIGLASFAFLIAILGLVGMAVQVAGRRVHEIGVRKSLGARQGQMVAMLLRDFSRPVVVANLVAWPLAYVAAQAYLSVFIQRTAITLAPFAVSLGIVLMVAWIAVGLQALRAARANPSEVLRFE